MYSYSILREPLLGYMCNTLNSSAENPKETQWQVGSAVEVTAILVSTYLIGTTSEVTARLV